MPQSPFKPRHLARELGDALASARIVNIVGPRQAGKTTFVRDLFTSGKFITLDDTTVFEALERDPYTQLQELVADLYDRPLVIDEVQRSPKLVLAIKRIVDENRRKGQFILTGSSNIFTAQQVSDSLAGRMRTLTLWPFSIAEVLERPPSQVLDWAVSDTPEMTDLGHADKLSRAEYIERVLRGGFPEFRELNTRQRNRQYRDYVNSVIKRDVSAVLKIRRTDAMRRMIDQLAARTASEVHIATLSRLIGIERSTTEDYVDVLLQVFMLTKLPAWTSSESKRDVKSAKFHFADTGLVSALRRMSAESFALDPDRGANPTALGPLLESFVHSELLKVLPYQSGDFRLYHWRDHNQREIDILAESAGRLVGIEVKASASVEAADFRHLKWFSQKGPGKSRLFTGLIFYLGEHKLSFGNNHFALPVSTLWAG